MSHLKELYRAEQLPVFQNRMFHSEADAKNCTKGDILLVQDLVTGLIFNHAFNPELMQYDADYQNEQAVSTIFQSHLNNVAAIINKHFQGNTLIEVGCGKGYFLEHLQEIGFEITGLDPTYEGLNPNVIREYFSPAIGLHADGIILRHVLEHVQDPVAFLTNLRDSNGGKGKIYIEVPCFDWICQHRAWFDIFYEHVNYFRLADFGRMFGHVHETGHVFGGQYLYVIADLATIQTPIRDSSDDFEFPHDLLGTVDYYANKLRTPQTKHGTQETSVIWGGASKGVIFALFMQRSGVVIDFIIDINPAKQGKYLAATGLRVSSPEEVTSQIQSNTNIFVMNSNYLPEIRKTTNNQFNYLTVDHETI
ncbi:class I SAM-dependent methyltransferase [Thiothrix sp.]|uniref:class I SAM-dependent methyltransferase n=1 Tax=Thiothrix sp. TaxID=1032 RepID=UPI00257B3F3C|nr:class I SAM-dependent methyltransferase [Thiothrix sp.]